MFNYYSCCFYANNRSNLLKPNLFLKQISLNLAIFGKMKVILEIKNYVSIIHFCGN